ncbi:hypothetical protein G5I_13804 [Acromyrmex echinatior]|uniref:Uncharacterized protein n=1 Tax=Acromyrmex echinatior TaxID=103372 RepID=F4X608_ACREC|nr:hypothetical protein G5I_13804 [Acromyrmex echinatior]
MKGVHSPYPGGSHATASQSAGCAAVRKEFARAGLIREPGSPGTSTLPYSPPSCHLPLPSYLAAHPPMPPTYGSLKYLPRCLQGACLSRYPPSPPSSPPSFSTLRSFRKPTAHRYPLTDPSRPLAPPLHRFPLPHTTRTSLLLEPPTSSTARTLTANYDVPREYNNSRGRPYLFPRNTTPRKSGRVAP